MNINAIMDRVLFTLSVPKCVCCKRRLSYGESALCLECSAEFHDFKTRNCSRCARVLNQCDCSSSFLEGHFVRRTVKCFRYLGSETITSANALIYSLKRDNREDVLRICTSELAVAIDNSVDNPESFIFTNVPRRKDAIVKYGIDHSELLARSLAKRFGAEYRRILKSKAKKAQKSLEAEERFKNAEFCIIDDRDITGRGVVIVDDIITSGASMSKAAVLIRSLGSKDIVAASLGIAYKDE